MEGLGQQAGGGGGTWLCWAPTLPKLLQPGCPSHPANHGAGSTGLPLNAGPCSATPGPTGPPSSPVTRPSHSIGHLPIQKEAWGLGHLATRV